MTQIEIYIRDRERDERKVEEDEDLFHSPCLEHVKSEVII